jgi:hypothetical protein
MNKHRFMTVISLLIIFFANGYIAATPIPPEIKKVVSFIFTINAENKLVPWGTAFFVAIAHPKNDNVAFTYMVTAKHVLQTEDQKSWQPIIFVRLNKTDGGSEIIPIPIIMSGENRNVYLHPDNTVDLAVIPVRLSAIDKVDAKTLPSEMITTRDDFGKLRIVEGSEVFFAGLFSPYIGTAKNYPIVRFGRVALITDEKIKFVGYEADLYLIETGSFGGNSGAPVFFYLGIDRSPGAVYMGPPITKLAGIMSGSFRDLQRIELIETTKVPIAPSNMGIAAVVPAYKLHELLFGDVLRKIREKNM